MMRLWSILLMVPLILSLSACGGDRDEPETAAAEPAADSSSRLRIVGEAFYLERILLPSGAWLDVALFDEDREEPLRSWRLIELDGPPYPFELEAELDLAEVGELTLYFSLHLPDGSPRFAAETRVLVGDSEPLVVRLAAIDGSESEPDEVESGAWLSWRCGEVPVDLRYGEDDSLLMALPWADVSLSLSEGTVRGLYRADDGHEFREMGVEGGMLGLPNGDRQLCRAADQASPWTRARDAGVSLRASGNEPFWLLELHEAESLLVLSLDAGAHRLEFEELEWSADRSSLVAHAPGNHAEISLHEAPCEDSMVGWVFPLRVEMVLNDSRLEACGRRY